MSTANLDAHDLKAVQSGGLIREDVMDKIWDISSIPLPFTDRIGGGTTDNQYTEWTQDKLRDPNLANKMKDGQDVDQNDTNSGKRLGNQHQISGKEVRISTRAQAVDSIGNAGSMAYQVMMRQRELRRDVEAIMQTGQASIEDDGDATAGQAAGVFSFIKTNAFHGVGGSTPGFDNTTKLVGAVVQGTKRGLTEKLVRDAAQKVFEAGGDPSVMMSRPAVTRLFSEYCFTSSARIATITSDAGQEERASVAKGAVNVFVTDFGVTLDLIPNRLQPTYATAASNIGLYDFNYIDHPKLKGYAVEPLAKTGLSDKRMMTVDWTLRVLNEEALAAIFSIDETVAVTQGT